MFCDLRLLTNTRESVWPGLKALKILTSSNEIHVKLHLRNCIKKKINRPDLPEQTKKQSREVGGRRLVVTAQARRTNLTKWDLSEEA